MMKKGLIIFSILISVFFAFKVNAQVQSGDIILGINPRYPKANQEVRASLSTFTINLNNANISWILNGETMLEGIGKKTFSFNSGSSGSQINLEVTIETTSGSTLNKKISISPSDVDLIWEAYNTYVPPFYKGKALASEEGNIKVVAIPSNQNLAGYSYNWKQDNDNQPSSSGYEKNYYLYQNSYLERENSVEVTVSDLFGAGIGVGKTVIVPGNPKVLFYEKDFNLGTRWEKTLNDGFIINQSGAVIIAEPYFFSQNNINSPNLTFDWFLNGEKTLIPDQKNLLAVKPEAGKSGISNIKVVINNIRTLFQSAENTINANF